MRSIGRKDGEIKRSLKGAVMRLGVAATVSGQPQDLSGAAMGILIDVLNSTEFREGTTLASS